MKKVLPYFLCTITLAVIVVVACIFMQSEKIPQYKTDEVETESSIQKETETETESLPPEYTYLETVKYANEGDYFEWAKETEIKVTSNDDAQNSEEEENEDNSQETKDDSEQSVSLVAESGILIDVNNMNILYSKDADKKMYPASTTKLMTALTALEYLDVDTEITVGEEIKLIAADASTAYLEEGDVLTVKELLTGMLICSGNDAAYVLALNAGKAIVDDNIAYEGKEFTTEEYIKKFIYYMNLNTEELGLYKTRFTTPDGYDDEGQYTTALDLSKIGIAAYNNETIREICGITSYYVESKDITWVTTNKLMIKDSGYYYKQATGLKTGSTGWAGKCMVSMGKKKDNVVLAVVLNSDDEGRWADSESLLRLGLED